MTSSTWQTAAAMTIVVTLAGYGFTVRGQANGTTGTSGTVGSSGAAHVSGAPSGGVAANAAGGAQTQLSAADQASAADAIVTRGTTLSQRVTELLDEARKEADMIRVTCLNDKLTQINANLRTAQSRLETLQKTVDADQRNHELTVLTVLGQKFQVLDQESNQCVGQDLYETGPTKVVTEIDTSVLPFEADPAKPQIQTPTTPSTVGVPDASSTGVPPG